MSSDCHPAFLHTSNLHISTGNSTRVAHNRVLSRRPQPAPLDANAHAARGALHGNLRAPRAIRSCMTEMRPRSCGQVSALAFSTPTSVTRRDALFAGAVAAAVPFAAVADGAANLGTLQKARLSYGQRVLALADAPADKIVAEAAAITLYESAVTRSKGLKVDPRKSAGSKIVAMAKVRDPARHASCMPGMSHARKLNVHRLFSMRSGWRPGGRQCGHQGADQGHEADQVRLGWHRVWLQIRRRRRSAFRRRRGRPCDEVKRGLTLRMR